ncbi:MAG TPA: TonB-dependent receptor [Candidatus Avirikenella pullistercoris]|nr:TonB-dependent receptor [Candidatus Avirikenella pullistercoris]
MEFFKIIRLFVFTVIGSALAVTAAAQDRFDVSGVVVDSISGKPLQGVYVTTGNEGGQSDRDGHFVIKDVPRGLHHLMTMYYTDYKMAVVDVTVENSNLTDIKILMQPELITIDDVVVTGTRTEKRLADVPVLTTLIKSQEMRKSGSTSLLESLQDNIPGIVFSPNGMGNNMRIKGLSSRYVLFLVDGERMVSEGAGGNVNFDQIDVNNIERIEVINGASSALYGSNAVGAVINIITKQPVHKFEAGVTASWQNYNTWKARADVGSNLERFSVRAGGFRNSSDGYNKENGAYAAKYEDYGGDLKLGFKPGKSGRFNISFTGRYYQHETFNPEGSMNTTHTFTQTVAGVLSGDMTSLNGRNNLKASVSYDKYFDFDILERKNNRKDKDNTAGYTSARLLDTYKAAEKWEIIGGFEYNHETVFSKTNLGANPTDKSLDDANLFAQVEYDPIENLDIVAGARYTHHSSFGSAFTPKLSIMYDVAGFKFRGGIGTAFRAPSVKELYYDFDHQGMFWVYGNPDLKAEKGLYSSLSAEYTKGTFNASVSGYYNNIDNKITQYDVVNPESGNEKYYKNVSSATLAGVDVSATYTLFRQVTFRANYSFCDARDNSTGLQLESNVKHSGTVSVTWNGNIARSPFSLQMAGRFNSPKLYQSQETVDGTVTTVREQSKRYNIWKVVLVKPFRINKHTIEGTFKVDNLFGFTDKSFVDPGRQYMVGLRYNFK